MNRDVNVAKKLQARYRYSFILLRQMVVTDFKLRYQGSALGYIWSLLRPLFLFLILYIAFVEVVRIGGDLPHKAVGLLVGIVLWNFFAEVTNSSVKAIVDRGDLIRKLSFPRYVVILSTAMSALINLGLNLIVIAVFMALDHVGISWQLLWVPLLIFEILIFALSAGFILSALYVRLRDINYIWEVIMQAMFYATPIIIPLSLIYDRWPQIAKLVMLNPMAQAIQDIRYLAVTDQTMTLGSIVHRWYIVALPFIIVVVTAIGAIVLFKKRSPHFAEEV